MTIHEQIPVINMAAPLTPQPTGSGVPQAPLPPDVVSFATLAAIDLPAAVVSISVNCMFTDDSSANQYDNEGGSYVAGNHGQYEVKLQQLQVNLQGNPSPDPYTGSPQWWADIDPVSGEAVLTNGAAGPAVVDLYGPGATSTYTGSNPVASANQSVSQPERQHGPNSADQPDQRPERLPDRLQVLPGRYQGLRQRL